jgi:hypothetical protein
MQTFIAQWQLYTPPTLHKISLKSPHRKYNFRMLLKINIGYVPIQETV